MSERSDVTQARTNDSMVRLAGVAGICTGLGIITHGLIPRVLGTWGATDVELTMRLPGDELIPLPDSRQTMAISITARPDQVWPWLVQMGVDRAGLYSYTWVENGLLRLGVVNADHLHPEWQDLKVGDIVAFTPATYPGGRQGPRVIALEKDRYLVLDMSPGAKAGTVTGTWQFALLDQGHDATRLFLRSQSGPGRSTVMRRMDRFLQPGYLIMSRAMLRGIKRRAERAISSPPSDTGAASEVQHQPALDSDGIVVGDSGEPASADL